MEGRQSDWAEREVRQPVSRSDQEVDRAV